MKLEKRVLAERNLLNRSILNYDEYRKDAMEVLKPHYKDSGNVYDFIDEVHNYLEDSLKEIPQDLYGLMTMKSLHVGFNRNETKDGNVYLFVFDHTWNRETELFDLEYIGYKESA